MVVTLHKRKVRFTVLVSYSDKLVVHSCSLFACKGKFAKLFCCWPLLRKNTVATNLKIFIQVPVVGVLPHVTVECRHLPGNATRAQGLRHATLEAHAVPSPRGGFGRLSPPKQSCKPPQIET